MTRLHALVLVCASALPVVASVGQANVPAAATETIRQVEQQRVKYLVSGDYDRLAAMTSPSLTYSHSAGALDTKESWLASLRSGQVAFTKLEHGEVTVRLLAPDVAMLNSLADVVVRVGGQPQPMTLRLTIVYVRKNGEWLFEAWHSSRRPD